MRLSPTQLHFSGTDERLEHDEAHLDQGTQHFEELSLFPRDHSQPFFLGRRLMFKLSSFQSLIEKLEETSTFLSSQLFYLQELRDVHSIEDEIFDTLLRRIEGLIEKINIQKESLESVCRLTEWDLIDELNYVRKEVLEILQKFTPIEAP